MKSYAVELTPRTNIGDESWKETMMVNLVKWFYRDYSKTGYLYMLELTNKR